MRIGRVTMISLAAVLALGAILSTAGCAPKPPSTPPGITGIVTSLTPGDERPANILVEAPAAATGSNANKAQVTVEPSTLFFDAQGKQAKGSAIAVGTNVNVWFVGAVAESFPVQATAAAIQILGQNAAPPKD
jgi:hypothetical protein